MLNYRANTGELTRVFRALGHPKRLLIFDLLMQGVQCNCEIAERLGYSLSLISHHMRVLEETGLIAGERDAQDARWVYYSVDERALAGLREQLGLFLDPGRIQPRAPCCGPKGCCDRG